MSSDSVLDVWPSRAYSFAWGAPAATGSALSSGGDVRPHLLFARQVARDVEEHAREAEAGDQRNAGQEPQHRHDSGGDGDTAPTPSELRHERAPELVARWCARDDDAGRSRHQQRGDLREERVADREHTEGLGCVREVHTSDEPEDEATDQVTPYQEPRDGVAENWKRRPWPCKIASSLDLSRRVVWGRGRQRDRRRRHLLARYVEREARRPPRRDPRLRDHDEVDDHQDQKIEADDDVAANDEASASTMSPAALAALPPWRG
jgi:hypothetical protein